MSRDNSTAPPRPRPAWCSWHKGLSDTAVLVQAHEEATGPGGNVYCCAPCRQRYRIVPLADRPL